MAAVLREPLTLENAASIDPGLPPSVTNVRSIAHQTADRRILGPCVNRRYAVARRQCNDLIGVSKKKGVAAHLECVCLLLSQVCKGRVDFAWATLNTRSPAP